MVTEQLTAESEQVDLPVNISAISSHPMDTSRVLLSMMDLARQGELAVHEDPESLDSVVSRSVLRRLLSALHFRDLATLMHSRRVALLSGGMAQQLGWEGRHSRVLEVSALLHDIGKIGVPDNILRKPGKLSSDEAELISTHHNIGTDVLQACRLDTEVIQIVADSQAYYDAPDEERPIGSDIHLGARILAVADAYDSLTHDQVFRERKSHEEAMAILMEDAGSKFDGNVVNALARWVQQDGLAFLMESSNETTSMPLDNQMDYEAAIEASTLCHIVNHLYVLESLYDGFYVLDSDLKFTVWNRGASNLLGRTSSQMLGQPWSSRLLMFAEPSGKRLGDQECHVQQVMATGQPSCRILQVQQQSGPWVEVELQTIPLKDGDGNLHGIAEILRDVSRSKRNAPQFRELKLAASRDALTGVANRGEMEKHLRHLFDGHDPETHDPFSVIFLDIDHFKNINDTHGHGVGDRVLIAVARLMQSELYSGELVARYGGEEFVVLCPSTDFEAAIRKAERIRTTLCETSIGEQPRLTVTASLGVAEIDTSDTMETLLHRADTALYDAKESGRNRTCSLAVNDVLGQQEAVQSKEEDAKGGVFRGSFTTCMMPEMAVYKVGGFVSETDAKVNKVTAESVSLQVGDSGFFRGWGSAPKRQPVGLFLEFTDVKQQSEKSVSKRVEVTVTMKPIGRPSSPDVFELRCKQLLELLRCHFAAD